MKTHEPTKREIQKILERELEKLKTKFGLAGHLRVLLNPQPSPDGTHGLVKNSRIFIFDTRMDNALHTLRHEFIEYILTSEFLESKLFELKAHRRADNLVDIIAKLVTDDNEGDSE